MHLIHQIILNVFLFQKLILLLMVYNIQGVHNKFFLYNTTLPYLFYINQICLSSSNFLWLFSLLVNSFSSCYFILLFPRFFYSPSGSSIFSSSRFYNFFVLFFFLETTILHCYCSLTNLGLFFLFLFFSWSSSLFSIILCAYPYVTLWISVYCVHIHMLYLMNLR